MKKLLILAALLCLAVPAAHAAPPAGKGKPEDPGASASAPGQSAQKNAAKACKAERGTSPQTIAAFKEKYGSNANTANALGTCVSAKAKAMQKASEREQEAELNAAKKCKAERGTTPESMAAFKEKYGSNANKANAFGKCVSKLAKQQGTKDDEQRDEDD